MTPQRVPLLFSGLVVLLAAACTTTDHDGATSAPSTAAAPSATAAPTPSPSAVTTTAPAPPTGTPAASDWRVTYGWAIPTAPARVGHAVRVPVTPAPGEPLPVLVDIRVGDHPGEGWTRVTFAFRGPTPGYQVALVDRVASDGSGDPIDLPGDADLSVRFDPAQGHLSNGRTSYTAPGRAVDLPTLRGWAPAGDFEGHLGFGLGLRTTGTPLPVRLAESTRPDGLHVVSVDVRRG
ncbi:hypothetical protein MRQ36_02625 [Micromonospora sp. R77]|uniref:AMIN-like domain-containing (lipo)protein n=1 Tax=Micromonospora sp. R77 TaxID=2925836 RepID=UPI001F600308|nr:hypothetical protein [Micromonospora sp. R77]MCI4061527.1 hypothetical protein [Micromonospora sp. R77]